jgi:hypothetical protein
MEYRPVMALFESSGWRAEDYEAVANQTNVVEHPPQGYICHFAGPLEKGWITGSVWTEREKSDTWLAGRLGDAIATSAHEMKRREGHIGDMTWAIAPVFRMTVGKDAEQYVGRDIGRADGAVMYSFALPLPAASVYSKALDDLKFDENPPEGLVLRNSGPFHEFWRSFDVWNDEEAAATHYGRLQDRLAALNGDADVLRQQRVTRVPLHTLLVPRQAQNLLKGYRAEKPRWEDPSRERGSTDLRFDQDTIDDLALLESLIQR